MFALNTTVTNPTIFPETSRQLPGNITHIWKVPLGSTDRAAIMQLNFPEPLPAGMTFDQPFSVFMGAGSSPQELVNNVSTDAWTTSSNSYVDLTRTNGGATLVATLTPITDTAGTTSRVTLPATVTAADGLTRYTLNPAGLTPADSLYPGAFVWTFNRTQSADTVITGTYVKQTRTCTTCTWTP